MKKIDAINILQAEINWSKSNKDNILNLPSGEWKDGFIAGLEQAIYVIKKFTPKK